MTLYSGLHISGESASMFAVESSASNAMHSEMDRRGGIGMDRRHGQLATLDHDFRTRASSPSKSLAASASEMWIHGQPSHDYTVIPRIQILPLPLNLQRSRIRFAFVSSI